MTENHEFSIDEMLNQILEEVKRHPNYTDIILTDLHSIINKFDPDIVNEKEKQLPLINPAFKQKVKTTKEKIHQILETKVKIPELRFEADRIAQELSIPLPNSTRKNNEALMQWFDSNWDAVEPKLVELKERFASKT